MDIEYYVNHVACILESFPSHGILKRIIEALTEIGLTLPGIIVSIGMLSVRLIIRFTLFAASCDRLT